MALGRPNSWKEWPPGPVKINSALAPGVVQMIGAPPPDPANVRGASFCPVQLSVIVVDPMKVMKFWSVR